MHGVVKESSTTTKLRVVFDASAKTSTGYSFNDIRTFIKMINQFRLNKICMSGDTSKIFHKISLDKSEYDFHHFIHRGALGELHDYRMCQFTFGMTSSPLLKLADDYENECP